MSRNNNAPASHKSATVSSVSTSSVLNSAVRPRNRRLISLADDGDDDGVQEPSSARNGLSTSGPTPSQSRGTTPSPYTSRRGSPLPQKQFTRISERDLSSDYGFDRDDRGSRDSFQPFNSSHNSSGFLEASWSSIQSLTSSFLGNDRKWGKPDSTPTTSMKRRKPSRSEIPVSFSKQQGPSTWGPLAPSTPPIGTGTQEERQALVQAKKREKLLLANGDSVSSLRDRYKRKDSLETPDGLTVDPDQDEEALVYIHHVQPNDSMTGLCIKYGCDLGVFRKANGFWPSDSIQTRKVVLLPAEACSVKGRRVDDKSNNLDLLSDDFSGGSSSEDPAGSSIVPREKPSTTNDAEATHADDSENERVWRHEAWVEMSGFPAPVEIGRVPRKSLGFFPRSRRKSLSLPYSDTDPTAATTQTTLDSAGPSSYLYSRDASSFNSTSSSRVVSAIHSPFQDARKPHRRNDSFKLQGPGGVGTLGRDVRAPGPAQDGLNKFVAQHLPTLSVPTRPVRSSTRKASFESTSSVISGTSSTGLENVGGAIEGWMRKMASRAKIGLNELQQANLHQGSSQGQALGIAGLGDLIELNDGLEGGVDFAHSTAENSDSIAQTRTGRNSNLGDNSQYERFSTSPSSSTCIRARQHDPHKND